MFLQNGGATFRRLHALHLWHGSFGDCEKMKCLSVFFRLRLDMFPDGQMASEEKAQSLFWALQLKWHFLHHYVGNPGGRAFQRWRSGASNQAGDCCGTNSHASLLFTDIFIFLVTIDVFMNMWCVCDYVCASADLFCMAQDLRCAFFLWPTGCSKCGQDCNESDEKHDPTGRRVVL